MKFEIVAFYILVASFVSLGLIVVMVGTHLYLISLYLNWRSINKTN